MSEYIKRLQAKEQACEGCSHEFFDEPCEPSDCWILRKLDDIPAADVVEVRHGEWVAELVVEMGGVGLYEGMKQIKYTCSLCGFRHRLHVPWRLTWKHCPNCGAKMDGKGEGE